MFNNLPESIRTLEFSKLKSRLKGWLTAKPFLSEYFKADKEQNLACHLVKVFDSLSFIN